MRHFLDQLDSRVCHHKWFIFLWRRFTQFILRGLSKLVSRVLIEQQLWGLCDHRWVQEVTETVLVDVQVGWDGWCSIVMFPFASRANFNWVRHSSHLRQWSELDFSQRGSMPKGFRLWDADCFILVNKQICVLWSEARIKFDIRLANQLNIFNPLRLWLKFSCQKT